MRNNAVASNNLTTMTGSEAIRLGVADCEHPANQAGAWRTARTGGIAGIAGTTATASFERCPIKPKRSNFAKGAHFRTLRDLQRTPERRGSRTSLLFSSRALHSEI